MAEKAREKSLLTQWSLSVPLVTRWAMCYRTAARSALAEQWGQAQIQAAANSLVYVAIRQGEALDALQWQYPWYRLREYSKAEVN